MGDKNKLAAITASKKSASKLVKMPDATPAYCQNKAEFADLWGDKR
jgi:hypothetical protein